MGLERELRELELERLAFASYCLPPTNSRRNFLRRSKLSASDFQRSSVDSNFAVPANLAPVQNPLPFPVSESRARKFERPQPEYSLQLNPQYFAADVQAQFPVPVPNLRQAEYFARTAVAELAAVAELKAVEFLQLVEAVQNFAADSNSVVEFHSAAEFVRTVAAVVKFAAVHQLVAVE